MRLRHFFISILLLTLITSCMFKKPQENKPVEPYTDAEPQYWAQRHYLSQLDAPLFLVLGNHDGEGAPKGKDGEEMSVWSAKLRTTLFPNPVPNDFYTGNNIPNSPVGDLQDYYAFTWGDALFVILDPYWFTPPMRGDSSLWTPTLGRDSISMVEVHARNQQRQMEVCLHPSTHRRL